MKNRLKELRSVLKYTQSEMADKANIGRSTYAMFETGDRIPKEIHISAICSATGSNETWLRTGIGDMFAPADDSAIDQLADKYHLRPLEKVILESFVKLPEAYRDGVLEYVKALVGSVIEHDGDDYRAIVDQQAERENHALRENLTFALPENESEKKARA